jgi:hypothetical protein
MGSADVIGEYAGMAMGMCYRGYFTEAGNRVAEG